jgi:hypothetical protein
MYNVHVTYLSKFTKTMSHLKFNVTLVKITIKKGAHCIPKTTTIVRAFVPNPRVCINQCKKQKERERKKVVCGVAK